MLSLRFRLHQTGSTPSVNFKEELMGIDVEVNSVVKQLVEFTTTYGLKVIGAILILVFGRIAAGLVKRSIRRVMKVRRVDPTIISFASSMAYFTILTVAVLAALSNFGIQTTSFIAVLGAAGFAVGLALQGSLSNFASGVLILLFRPFKIGDYIKAGGTEGEVKDIHLFVTELATPDNVQVIVPNSAIMGGNISNVTGYDKRRVDLLLSVGHGVSLARVKELVERILADDPRVLEEPAPHLGVRGLTGASVDLTASAWVKPGDYGTVQSDMYRRLHEAFSQAGIAGPDPAGVVVRMAKE
jgi:small conductance mechanosensitive channel